MAATLVLSQANRLNTETSAALDVPPGAAQVTALMVMSDTDAGNPLLTGDLNLQATYDNGVTWVQMAGGQWQGAPPRVEGQPPARPGISWQWDAAHPPQRVRTQVGASVLTNYGLTLEFA